MFNNNNQGFYLMRNIPLKLITGVIISVIFIMSCSRGPGSQNTADQVRKVNVETRTLRPQMFSSYVRLVGTVESANDIQVASEANGRIEQYFVREGDSVQKGERIAKIDDAQLRQELERLQAVTNQSREQFERQKRIWKEDSIGSEIEYLNAKYAYQQNKAALERLRVQLNNTEVRAPFAGVVEEILTEQGEMVMQGAPMVRLIGSGYLQVTAGVPARYSDVVRVGDSTEIWFDTVQSDTLTGRITFVGHSIDDQTRTFPIEIAYPDGRSGYKVGMVANVRLRTHRRPNSIVIGEEYIYEEGENYVVYTVDTNDQGAFVARKQFVKKGPAYGSNVVIETGLTPGDQLITLGSSFLDDEMRIEIVGTSGGEDARNTPSVSSTLSE